MTSTISVAGLSSRYRKGLALDDLTFEVVEDSITGLLGRNGAGKTTLLRILAAQEFASAGSVQVLGDSPVEKDSVLRRLVLVREDQAYPNLKVRQVLHLASWCYPHWSAGLADKLVADFDLPLSQGVNSLSRGMRSALGIVLGLAARAEVTLFDEPYAGLDAVARRLFYDRLLADFAEHPRTVVISTHLVDEIADLLERVLVLDRGQIVVDAATDELRGAATAVSGSAVAVEQFLVGRRTVDHRHLGSQGSAVVMGGLDETDYGLAPPRTTVAAAGDRQRHQQFSRCRPRRDAVMTTWINVVRYHLTDWIANVAVPWAILAFVFVVNLVITIVQGGPNPTKALLAIYAVFLFLGVLNIVRSLPFGLALGMSRGTYYTGTVLFVASLAAVYGLALAILQAIERATGGWGVQLLFFQPSYLFGGAWYLTWLTTFVGLALLFIYGTWFGIVFYRWNLGGLIAFVVVQATLVRVGVSVASADHAWRSIGHYFTQIGAAGLTGMLAAATVALLAGGYALVRRVSV